MAEGLEPVSAVAEKIEGSNASRQVQRNRELEMVSPISPAERS